MSELSESLSRCEVPSNSGALLSLYRDIPDPAGYVELGEIEGHTPYGPTPCKPFAPESRGFQTAILHNLADLAATPYPEDTPNSVASAIESDFLTGFVRREEKNHHHYLRWSEFGGKDGADEITFLRQDDYFNDIITRAERGYATPEELIQLMQNSTLHATNLASIAIPYGRRAQYVPEMRDVINDAIIEHGGILYDAEDTSYRNIELPARHADVRDTFTPHEGTNCVRTDVEILDLDVLLTTYLRDVGAYYSHDGTLCKVVERQAVAIRTDEASGFPQDLKELLKQPADSEDFMSAWNYVSEVYIQTNAEELFLIPLSVSVFTHRDEKASKLTVGMLSEYQLRQEAEQKARNVQLTNVATLLAKLQSR